MILVTGASGTVGRAVLEALGPRKGVLAASRSRRVAKGQRWFDYEQPDSYAGAVAGVTALFLLLPPGLPKARDRFGAVLEAAKHAGVRHAVFLSIRNAERIPVLPHRTLEKVVEESGLTWTHIRPNDFMQNFATQPVYRDGIRRGELWAAGGRSRTSYVDVRDVGEVAAKALLGGYEGQALSLTGPEELSLADIAMTLSDVLGRPISDRRPSILGFIRHALRSGAPPPLAAVMASIGLVARLGLSRGVDPDMERVLARKGRSFAQFARDNQAAWAPPD